MYSKLGGFGQGVELSSVRLFDLQMLFCDNTRARTFAGLLLKDQRWLNHIFEHIIVNKETRKVSQRIV